MFDAGDTPAATALFERNRLLGFFHDFFEAWIATQRVPIGIEAEVTVRRASRDLGECFKLLNSQVALANLRADRSIKIKDPSAVERVFCYR